MPQIPDAIQWHEGMLLMPQHFQQMATRYEGLIQSAVANSSPYAWGVLRFEYDRSALAGGVLRVLHVEAVMKDGLAVAAGSEMGIDLEINLKSFAGEMRAAPVTIYLTVPAQRAFSTRGDLARYISHEGEAVADEATGDDAVSIPRLRPRVGLWAGDLPPARYDGLPVMRIQAQNDAFQEHDYVPPCISVPLVSALGKACSETLATVRSKSYVLADELRSQSLQKEEQTTGDVRPKLLALAAGLPAPEAALHSERSHPFTLYLLMCQLAGQMASITAGMVPPQFPPYRHEDLARTFEPVLEFIRTTAAEALIESWSTVSFRAMNGRFEATPSSVLDQAFAASSTLEFPAVVLGLRAAPGVPTEAVWRWGEGSVIATASLMPVLLSNRVSGAQRKRLEHLPGIVPQRGMVLLALSFDESAAKPGEPLMIIERFVNEGRPQEAVLYVRRPEVAGGKS